MLRGRLCCLRSLRLRLRDRGTGLVDRLLDSGSHRVHSGVHHGLRLIRRSSNGTLRLRDRAVNCALHLLCRPCGGLSGLLRGR